MKIIELDASQWKKVLDFYDALAPALAAANPHANGSIAALIDSMVWGGINKVEPPYRVRVVGTRTLSPDVRGEVERLQKAILEHRADMRQWHNRDVDVEVEIVP